MLNEILMKIGHVMPNTPPTTTPHTATTPQTLEAYTVRVDAMIA